ncbi:MAG: SpaH/EbpB family LPXTG-anchored major pilin [Blautia sp.]|nr:SpaH/EbpB family LPXTG-anchored major pilin [Lachnoclostridium sp.]MCM1211614.1 SpaH/EbpB family LPXTG-anchored major pilin [Blautia sp.]
MVIVGALLPGGTVEAAEDPAPATSPGINFSEDTTGSITIHKYEYNGDGGSPGTGKPEDINNVPNTDPDKATPLEGVTFTIYQVRTATQLKAIYQGTATDEAMPKLEDYCNGDKKSLKDGSSLSKFTVGGLINPGKTDSTGVVSFNNLPIGIYLVVETDAPSKVTTKSDAFFVSIPTTIDSNDWLYDVHVYPKNATTYGQDVTLIKKGSDDKLLGGVTFELQRQEKDDGGNDIWEKVTITDNDGKEVSLTTSNEEGDSKGKITISKLPPGTYRLIETNIGDNTGYIGDFTKAYEFVVKPDGTIAKNTADDETGDEEKYNYISVNGDGSAKITVINEKPDVEKKVKGKDKDGKEDWVQEADYSVGDTISYQIRVTVPANIANLKMFKVTDTPNNIKYATGTLRVYKADRTTLIGDTNYTLDTNIPTDGFTVIFNTKSDKITENAGRDIYITYDAELQEGAVNVNGTVNAGNTNTVQLTYSRYAKTEAEEGDPEDTIEDTTVVYTFQLDIVKKGKDDDGTEEFLPGVTFDLYQETTFDDSAKVSDADAKAAGLNIGTNTSKKYWKKIKSNLTTSNEGTTKGKVSITGLKNGTYYLVETATAAGYNLLSKPVEVVLNADYDTAYKTDNEYSKDENGNYIYTKHEIDDEHTTITQTITVNKGNASVTGEITILNTKGFTLPTTGGMGGFVFAVVGCMVMIAGILLFKKTKKKPESE